MFVTYPSIFYKEDGQYSVLFPDFEGGTCGETLDDAYRMAIDWLGIQLTDYYVENKPLPKSTNIECVSIEDCLGFLENKEQIEAESKKCFKTLIGFDLTQYIKDTQKTTIRKNVTIPSWLNEMGKSHNLNFSNLLQEAIKKELEID